MHNINPKAPDNLNLLEKLKNADKDSNVDPVLEGMWYTYVKELNTSDNTNSENPLVDADLKNLERIKKSELDNKINTDEVLSAINSSKTTKLLAWIPN